MFCCYMSVLLATMATNKERNKERNYAVKSLTYETFLKSESFIGKHALKSHNMENFVHCVVCSNYSDIPAGKENIENL